MTVDSAAVGRWVRRYAEVVAEQRAELVRLDTAIGDGDHGTNLDRGMRKAVERLDGLEADDVGATLKGVGTALVSSVGGAAGPLYGTLFMAMGKAAAGETTLGPDAWAAALRQGLEGVQARGKAQLGDKTMLDALSPGVEALEGALGDGASFQDALRRAAEAAAAGVQATVEMEARKGRASYLGPRSVGHADPGATSTQLLLAAAAETLIDGNGGARHG